MKFFIGVIIAQLLMLAAAVCVAYQLYNVVKEKPPAYRVVGSHTYLMSKYKPSEHASEAQHKFEASVKRTD